MQNYYRRTTCRLCESSDLALVMHFPPTPIGDEYVTKDEVGKKQNEYALDLIFCNHCGFLQIPDVVSPELLYKNYTYETNISLNLADHFQQYADTIIDYLKLAPDSLVFEIGCNDGTLLKCFKNRNLKTVGIEPATRISQKAASKGLTIVNDFFSSSLAQNLNSNYSSADLICANNVLANIDNLRDFFLGIKILLKPEGIFIFESGYMIDLIDNDVIDNIYHEHLSYFSVAPLAKHLKAHGLELFHVEHVNTKGGSMRYFIQKTGGKNQISNDVKTYLKNEIDNGFTKDTKFLKLSKKHSEEKAKLITLLEKLKGEGAKIAGFGASVGVTTLIYYYEIAQYIDFLVDDNVKKHGQYSPGFHIPIYPTSKIYEENIDYIVCFPWRYIDPIKNKNYTFSEKGGKFILPLPEIKII